MARSPSDGGPFEMPRRVAAIMAGFRPRPLQEMGTSVAGLPILMLEIVLLYKAKAPRARDEEDFQNALDALGPQ